MTTQVGDTPIGSVGVGEPKLILRREARLPTLVLEGCAGRWDDCRLQIPAFHRM